MEDIILRIKQLMGYYGLNISETAKKIGVSQPNLSAMLSGKRPIGGNILNKFTISFGINRDWLESGKGEMINPAQTTRPFPEKANYVDGDINERISKIAKDLFDKQTNKMAQKTFIGQKKLEAMMRGDETPDYDDFCNVAQHTNVNLEWLITGKGPMLKEAASDNIAEKMPALKIREPKEKLIPLYRNEAAAGFGSPDFAIKDTDVEGYYKIMEFMNADFMLRVRGDSMLPLYKPGDTIAVREIKQINFIQWGKPHLIAARYQGLLIKRIYPTEQKEEIKAISENKEMYPPFKIPMDEITGLALIIGTVRLDNF